MGWAEAIGAIAPVVGQIMGQREANETNVQIANQATATNTLEAARNRDWQADENLRNRRFQERMSNTAYQRSMTDLKKAGLNPLIALGGGSSSPSGASSGGAQGQAVTASVNSEMQGLVTAAKEMALLDSQIKNVDADTKKKNMETKVKSKDVPKAEMMNYIYKNLKSGYQSQAKKNSNLYKKNKTKSNPFGVPELNYKSPDSKWKKYVPKGGLR